MTDLEFMNEAEQLLCNVEHLCDQWNDGTDVDVDVQRSGAVLTLVFANRSQIVINLQKPLHEVWLAASAGGFHYRWQQGQWCDTRQGEGFWLQLQRCASQQAGMALPLQ